jgi:hypothetical protein
LLLIREVLGKLLEHIAVNELADSLPRARHAYPYALRKFRKADEAPVALVAVGETKELFVDELRVDVECTGDIVEPYVRERRVRRVDPKASPCFLRRGYALHSGYAA